MNRTKRRKNAATAATSALTEGHANATTEPVTIDVVADTDTTSTDFMTLVEPDDDLVTGIGFDTLIDAPDHEVITSLAMTALAATGPSGWARAVRLLHRAADHVRRRPLEHFVTDDASDEH